MKTWEREIHKEDGYSTDRSLSDNENNISLSPYDVPEAIKLSYGEPPKGLQIEFEYLTPNEPTVSRKIRDRVQLVTGVLTRKLYVVRASDVTDVHEGFEQVKSALMFVEAEYRDLGPRYTVPQLNVLFVIDFLEWLKKKPEMLEI